MKIINKEAFIGVLTSEMVDAMDLDDVCIIAQESLEKEYQDYPEEELLTIAKDYCSFLLEDETLVEKEKPMYVDWSEPFTDIYPLTKQLHECLALGKWTEAEVIAYKLKNITSDIYGICVSNSVHSGVGFTEPYHYES